MVVESRQLRKPLVVGVDGSKDGLRAVEYAAGEAARLGCGVRLVHALHVDAPVAPMLPLFSSEGLEEVAGRVCREAAVLVERLSGGTVPTELVVRAGSAVWVLLDAVEDARAVVLGHRDLGAARRIFTSSTTSGVAARAHVPVVSVPADWRSNRARGMVLAGVDGSSASREVLAAAFAAASDRNATLRVLHAWRGPGSYEFAIEPAEVEAQWRAEAGPLISEIVAGWCADYPDVPVETVLHYQRPVDALVRASASADLLVVGRHGAGPWAGVAAVLMGSTARAVLRKARCPVQVTPHVEASHREHEQRFGGAATDLVVPTY